MYYLEDYYGKEVKGGFYEQELQKVSNPDYFPVEKVLKTRTRNRVKENFNKLLGYEKPVWLPAADTQKL